MTDIIHKTPQKNSPDAHTITPENERDATFALTGHLSRTLKQSLDALEQDAPLSDIAESQIRILDTIFRRMLADADKQARTWDGEDLPKYKISEHRIDMALKAQLQCRQTIALAAFLQQQEQATTPIETPYISVTEKRTEEPQKI